MRSLQQVPQRRRRWRLWMALTMLVGLGGLCAGLLVLPWIVEVPWVQRQLSLRANRLLAPGGVRFDHLQVSWSRPTELEGLVLRDPQGDEVVVAPRARWSWTLWEILVTRPGSSTLTLHQADLDIERSADGIVDLLETLKPILSDRPVRTLLIRVDEGKLRFRNQGLSVPFLADKANIGLDLNAYPQPITWRMALVRSVAAGKPGSVAIQGARAGTSKPTAPRATWNSRSRGSAGLGSIPAPA